MRELLLSAVLSLGNLTCAASTSLQGLEKSMEQLGPHVGQLTMNETMSSLIFDYAVIPGKAMKLSEFKDGAIMTRAKEPLYVLNYQ